MHGVNCINFANGRFFGTQPGSRPSVIPQISTEGRKPHPQEGREPEINSEMNPGKVVFPGEVGIWFTTGSG